MRDYTKHMAESGYLTAQDFINRHPLITSLFAWTPLEINNLARMNVIRSRQSSKAVYVCKADLLELAQFLTARQAERLERAQKETA